MKEIHPSAIIHPTALLGEDISIGPFCYVGEGVKIGDGCILISHITIEDHAQIGKNCRLEPHSFLAQYCEIGENSHLHPHTSIGSPGFGYATDQKGVHHYIPQIGIAKVGPSSVVGANTCIDRAAMDISQIGKNSQLGALSHLAHNVELGENLRAYHELVIAGSTKVGDHFSTSGRAAITGHVKVGDQVHLNANTSMNNGDLNPGSYYGFPHETKENFDNRKFILKHLAKILELITQKKDKKNEDK